MKTDKKADKKKLPNPPLKPKNTKTQGTPDNNDPNAQYEDKDES